MEKKPPKHGCGGDDCAHDDETCNFEVPSSMDHKTSDLTHVDDDTIHDPLLEALHSHNNYRTLLNSSPLAPSTSTDKHKHNDKDKDKHASPSIISSVFGSISISGHSHRHQPETDEITNSEYRSRTRTTFLNDAITFAEGTIPQSIVIAIVIGIVCGFVAFGYYCVLNYLLRFFWKDLPQRFVVQNEAWPEEFYFLWIPLVSLSLSLLCGASIYYLGEPGDLAFTIQCVHKKAYEGTSHILPMAAASLFSILAGGSLGPEAPLVAICAATAGFVSKKIFKQTNKNVVRKHTLMGMSGALSAFFGVPLGGSIFALEVTSRFGVEYYEHLIEAIFCGEVCVAVFRSLAHLPLEQIWEISPTKIEKGEPYIILIGAAIGLIGAGIAWIWANFHWRLMDVFRHFGLLDNENLKAVPRVMLGSTAVVIIGIVVPHSMFWGEFEFDKIASLAPASELPHVWPTSGLIGFEMNSFSTCLVVGFCKLLAISFSVAGGYRGGFIFPFFTAGAAFGRALCFLFPRLSPTIATLCFAAGINVSITRTALATSLILSFLSGEQLALPAVLSASIVSLFATGYMPFIRSQIEREMERL